MTYDSSRDEIISLAEKIQDHYLECFEREILCLDDPKTPQRVVCCKCGKKWNLSARNLIFNIKEFNLYLSSSQFLYSLKAKKDKIEKDKIEEKKIETNNFMNPILYLEL